jgi:hypothetical protein
MERLGFPPRGKGYLHIDGKKARIRRNGLYFYIYHEDNQSNALLTSED